MSALINRMLKTYTYVFTSSAIDCNACANDTHRNACVECAVWIISVCQLSNSIQNSKKQRTQVETYSGTDYNGQSTRLSWVTVNKQYFLTVNVAILI
jgi:hypothetical protein